MRTFSISSRSRGRSLSPTTRASTTRHRRCLRRARQNSVALSAQLSLLKEWLLRCASIQPSKRESRHNSNTNSFNSSNNNSSRFHRVLPLTPPVPQSSTHSLTSSLPRVLSAQILICRASSPFRWLHRHTQGCLLLPIEATLSLLPSAHPPQSLPLRCFQLTSPLFST